MDAAHGSALSKSIRNNDCREISTCQSPGDQWPSPSAPSKLILRRQLSPPLESKGLTVDLFIIVMQVPDMKLSLSRQPPLRQLSQGNTVPATGLEKEPVHPALGFLCFNDLLWPEIPGFWPLVFLFQHFNCFKVPLCFIFTNKE